MALCARETCAYVTLSTEAVGIDSDQRRCAGGGPLPEMS